MSSAPPTPADFKNQASDVVDKILKRGKIAMVIVAEFDDPLSIQDAGKDAADSLRSYGAVSFCRAYVSRPAIVDVSG